MTPQNEIRLKNAIRDNGDVELTIVDKNDNVTEKTFNDFDEAKIEIMFLENEHEVFF